jgi:hypothetical protein
MIGSVWMIGAVSDRTHTGDPGIFPGSPDGRSFEVTPEQGLLNLRIHGRVFEGKRQKYHKE